jgi:eukaryotic-like serine/threonine-protein kinase
VLRQIRERLHLRPFRERDRPADERRPVNGKSVLTGSRDNTARLWEAATSKPLGPPFQHQALVGAVAISPDGKNLLTGSGNNSRLWHMPRPIEGDPERILLWAQVITGLELDEFDGTRGLNATAWERRRLRLQELGGAPPLD